MAHFAEGLSRQLHRMVLDRTGLSGRYDITIEFALDQTQPTMFEGANPGAGGAAPPDMSGPSIFTAIREQLGLKLVSTKGPVEVLVIEHIERPSEN